MIQAWAEIPPVLACSGIAVDCPYAVRNIRWFAGRGFPGSVQDVEILPRPRHLVLAPVQRHFAVLSAS